MLDKRMDTALRYLFKLLASVLLRNGIVLNRAHTRSYSSSDPIQSATCSDICPRSPTTTSVMSSSRR